jgi:hypothetical protein
MTLHLQKLAVGIADPDHLARVQAGRAFRRDGRTLVPGWTRRAPTRADALLAGGSIYWVVKGTMRVRQRLVGLETDADDGGREFCRMLLDPELVPVIPTPRKPFQGWRYLRAEDAPPDLAAAGGGAAEMPGEMLSELRALGLL